MMGIPFDPQAVRSLATILADTGLTEIEIENKDGRIRVVRAPAPIYCAPSAPASIQVAAAAAVPPVRPAEPAEQDFSRHPGAVLSPMVGVAFLGPEPGAPPFIVPGQSVAAGQTLLLIEAMKTFNQVKAPKAGTVTRILVASGAPVEFGEPLVILE
jgi:acetyl-CoA carboxylase biotin carboxyl carrier protein